MTGLWIGEQCDLKGGEERMAEKVNILADSIVSRAILKQINVLEDMQERAMNHNDSEAVCALSECIIAAAESYDRHVNSDCDNTAVFDKAVHGKSDPVRPPSDRLIGVATGIYKLENIDGMSVDGILEKIKKAEVLGYPSRK